MTTACHTTCFDPPRCRQRGVTILELLIAFSILAVAIMGTLGLFLAVHTHNESADDARVSYKACQEVMEQLLGMTWANMMNQNGVTFVATKIHPTAEIGTIQVTNTSPAGDPNSMAEITVSINSATVTRKPVNVRIVSWRANK